MGCYNKGYSLLRLICIFFGTITFYNCPRCHPYFNSVFFFGSQRSDKVVISDGVPQGTTLGPSPICKCYKVKNLVHFQLQEFKS